MPKTVRIPVASVDDPDGDFFNVAYERQWTDGLPFTAPTPRRIERFLNTVDRGPDEILAVVPPRRGLR